MAFWYHRGKEDFGIHQHAKEREEKSQDVTKQSRFIISTSHKSFDGKFMSRIKAKLQWKHIRGKMFDGESKSINQSLDAQIRNMKKSHFR